MAVMMPFLTYSVTLPLRSIVKHSCVVTKIRTEWQVYFSSFLNFKAKSLSLLLRLFIELYPRRLVVDIPHFPTFANDNQFILPGKTFLFFLTFHFLYKLNQWMLGNDRENWDINSLWHTNLRPLSLSHFICFRLIALLSSNGKFILHFPSNIRFSFKHHLGTQNFSNFN